MTTDTPDMGIRPCNRNSRAYLVDVENDLALHVYDDRGMDVVSPRKKPLVNIFTKYYDWLLNYDLARMTSTFGKKCGNIER